MIFDLVKDFADVLDAMPREHPRQRLLKLLDEAIRRDVHFIDRHPTTLFQCLWNTCWWYDCPEAVEHYRGDIATRAESGLGLCGLLEKWRALKEPETPRFVWMRCRRPPPLPLTAGLLTVLLDAPAGVRDLALTPDGRRLALALSDDSILIRDAASGEPISHVTGLQDVRCVAWSPNGDRLAAGLRENGVPIVQIWDSLASTKLARLPVGTDIKGIAFLSGGIQLAVAFVGERGQRATEARYGSAAAIVAVLGGLSGAQEPAVKVWNLATGRMLASLGRAPFGTCDLAVSGDGCSIAALYDRGSFIGRGAVFRRDPTSNEEAALWDEVELSADDAPHGFVKAAFSSDGSRLAVLDANGTIHCWAMTTQGSGAVFTHEPRLIRTREPQRTLTWTKDDRHIISGSYFGTLRSWDVANGAEVWSIRGHSEMVTRVLATRDGRSVISGSADGRACLWNLEQLREQRLQHTAPVYGGLALHPQGNVLASVSVSGSIQIWDPVRGVLDHTLSQADSAADRLEFSPTGDRLVAFNERSVRSWQWPDGKESRIEAGPGEENGRLVYALSPDGRLAVTACRDHALAVWDLVSGRQVYRWIGHRVDPLCIAFSYDGQRVASGDGNGEIRLWEAANGRLLKEHRLPLAQVSALAFAPNGRRLISGDSTGAIRVWDGTGKRGLMAALRSIWVRARYVSGGAPSNGEELGCLQGHAQRVQELAVSSDGRSIVSREQASTGVIGAMRVWDLHSGYCSEVIDGNGDAQGIADSSWRGLVKRFEIAVQFAPTGDELAWYPARCMEILTLGDGRSWAAVEGDHLYFWELTKGEDTG